MVAADTVPEGMVTVAAVVVMTIGRYYISPFQGDGRYFPCLTRRLYSGSGTGQGG
jgi:hypothetical protein